MCIKTGPKAGFFTSKNQGLLAVDGLGTVSVPAEDVKFEVVQVALLVPADLTDWRFHAVGVQVVGHFDWIVLASALDAFGNRNRGCVSGQLERAARIALLVLESLDDGLVVRILREVRRQGQQHAFNGFAGNRVNVRVPHAFWTHEVDFHALLSGLTQQQAHFRVVATKVHEVHAGGFQLGDDGGVIAVARVNAFKQGNFGTGFCSSERTEAAIPWP